MKKISTLVIGLLSLMCTANAATVDDLVLLKHSYVLVCDDLGARPGKGALFGNDHFLDLKGGTTATNKGKVDLSQPGPTTWEDPNTHVVEDIPQYITDDIIAKYGEEYGGGHYNWLRLKNDQDIIAMNLTAGSKVIMYLQGNNKIGKEARIPKVSKSADLSNALNAAPDEAHARTVSGFRWEYVTDDDGVYYFGSYNGDMFVSFIIIEANEAPGTPSVKVGAQTFEGGLWFREVTCKSVAVDDVPTVVTYTTDGTEPTAASTVYTAPIKAYKDQVIKFQAFLDGGDGTPLDDLKCEGADNEAPVSFIFDAPALEVNGAAFTVTSPYEGAKNYFSYGEVADQEGNGATLTESATVTAYSKIENGTYTTFVTKSVSADVYVLNEIKEEKNITVSGTAVVDEEATATSTTGTVYKIENGAVTADKMDFFVKNLTFGALANADAAKAKYQVPAGQEAYIQMSNTNISFSVAEGDSVEITVVCSKNSCKNIDEEITQGKVSGQDTISANRQCFVNVDGTNYGGEDLALNPEGNVITFRVGPGIHTFQKYSGTGNILISSIKFVPMIGAGVENIAAAEQKVGAKKVFRNGRLVIETANGTFNVAGVRVK
ncbi:MAG: chitobiase/beta-hexosaminidase C-terminal domain-containing protein [Bacteroidales bacterium]|nr:chitobiase/beta-hexosaminidase C-terminal domain-containing protein [Bacteroidales bacterium]